MSYLRALVGAALIATSCGAVDTPRETPPPTAVTTSPVPSAPATTSPATTSPATTSPATTSPATTTPTGAGDCPEVVAVELSETAAGVFTVDTTVRSTDIVDVSFADAWEVRDPAGTVLGQRVLAHPHVNEQPFTRSLSGVEIPRDVMQVEVAARDSVRGFCGTSLLVAVPHS